jgi:hypothetical protein
MGSAASPVAVLMIQIGLPEQCAGYIPREVTLEAVKSVGNYLPSLARDAAYLNLDSTTRDCLPCTCKYCMNTNLPMNFICLK